MTQPANLKREIVFHSEDGTLAECLITPERNAEITDFINAMLLTNSGTTLQEIVVALNDRGDLTDNEWTGVVYALGVFDGRNLQ